MLALLVADYVRDVEGTYDVLRDALIERGLEPLPRAETAADRLEGAFARLPAGVQQRVAAAAIRRLADRGLIVDALDAVDAGRPLDALRSELFRAWTSATGDRRVVWAAWMLLRGTPTIAMRTARSIGADELEAQTRLVADAFAGVSS